MGRPRYDDVRYSREVEIADNELRLVSKIIRERDIKPALDRGVQASWFVNPEAKMMWEVLVEHYQKYSVVPTPVTVKDILPGCRILDVQESFDYIVDAFCEWRINGLTVEAVQKANLAVDDQDFAGARELLYQELAKIDDAATSGQTNDVDLTKTTEERIARYLALRDLPDDLLGISTGFPTIDEATQGLQCGQLITLVATPKTGKSTLVEAIAKNVHDQDFVPLLISFEMSNDEQSSRIDSMVANMAHVKLQTGRIDDRDERRLRERLGKMADSPATFHLVADPASVSTVSLIGAKLDQYDPDVLFIDGAYLMRDEVTGEYNTPTALTNITRSLKRLAQKRGIPIFIATQALTWKTKGGKLTGDSIGYSSSFFQDSDVILGLQKIDEEEESQEERLLRILASRNCPNTSVVLVWLWSEGRFEEYADD